MPAFNDPSSPIGKSIPLLPSDIERLRKGGDHRTVAAKAFDLDPYFRNLFNGVIGKNGGSLPDDFVKRPELLLNRHYFGQWELEPTDDLTATLSQPPQKQNQGLIARKRPAGVAEGPIFDTVRNTGESIKGNIRDAAMTTLESAENLRQEGPQSFAKNLARATGAMAGGVGKTGFDIFGMGLKVLGQGASTITPDIIEEPIVEGAKAAGSAVIQSDIGPGPAIRDIGQAIQGYQSFKQKNPEAAKDLEAAEGIGEFILAMQGLESTGKAVAKTGAKVIVKGQSVIRGLQSPVTRGAEFFGTTPDELLKVVRGAGDDVKNIEKAVSETFGKSYDDFIMQLSDEGADLSKLNASEAWRIAAEKATGSSDDVARLLQPKRTAKELQELYKKNPSLIQQSKGGKIFSQKGPKPTGDEMKLADDVRRIAPEIKGVKSPVDAGPIVAKKIAEKGAFVDDALGKNNFALPRKESVSAVKKAVLGAADDFGEQRGVFEAELNRFMRFREQTAGTGLGEREALKLYDADTAQRFGSAIYDKATARAQAIGAVRDASHATLETAAQRAGFAYLTEVEDMAKLYRALDNLATQISPDVFNSAIKNIIKNNKLARTAIEAAGIATGIKLLP